MSLITATSLQQSIYDHCNQYHDLTKHGIKSKFMRDFKVYLIEDLKDEGYSSKNSEEFLSKSSEVGIFSVAIYHGYLPEELEDLVKPDLIKYLIKFFKLKSFDGFNLDFVRNHKNNYLTTINLSWWQRPDKNPTSKNTPTGRLIAKEPLKVIKRLITEEVSQQLLAGVVKPSSDNNSRAVPVKRKKSSSSSSSKLKMDLKSYRKPRLSKSDLAQLEKKSHQNIHVK